MKKFFSYAMMLAVALTSGTITSCSSDDDEKEGSKSYDLTLTFKFEGDITANDVKTLDVVLTNDKEQKTTYEVKGDTTLSVVEGAYSITVSGKITDENFSFATGVANVELYSDKAVEIKLAKVIESPLIFKRLYINGGYEYYMKDSYFEIVNNSDEVQYLDGLILTAPQFFSAPNAWQENGMAHLYPCGQGSVVQFPGTGKDYPIQPGQSVVVANNAANHTELGAENGGDAVSPDLSGADWEIYLDYAAADEDYPAPNLNVIFYNNAYMFAFGLGVAGRGYVLARLPEGMTVDKFTDPDGDYVMYEPGSESTIMNYLVVPSDWVLDAVEIRASDASDDDYIPMFLAKDDARGVKGNPMYSGLAIQRKVARTVGDRVYYQDTNNSANDFEIGVSAAIK